MSMNEISRVRHWQFLACFAILSFQPGPAQVWGADPPERTFCAQASESAWCPNTDPELSKFLTAAAAAHQPNAVHLGGGRVGILGATNRFALNWPDGKLHFLLDKSVLNSPGKADLVREAATYINEISDYVRLDEITEADADDFDGRYVKIINDGTCWAHVGYLWILGNEMSVGGSACNKMGIVHEFLHSLGLVHEHERQDRSDYIDVECASVRSDAKSEYSCGTELLIIPRSLLRFLVSKDLTEYDFLSVMHYSPLQGVAPNTSGTFKISNNLGMNRIRAQAAEYSIDPARLINNAAGIRYIGQEVCMSKLDQRALNMLYCATQSEDVRGEE